MPQDFKDDPRNVEVETEFHLSQQVWYVKETSVQVPCPICKGKSTVMVDGVLYRCFECREGKVWSMLLSPALGKVVTVEIRLKERLQSIMYEVAGMYITEGRLFATEEECRKEIPSLINTWYKRQRPYCDFITE